MVIAYPPFYPQQILDGDGQPVANGAIRAAFAGSDVPAPLFTPDGTALGSSVTLNSSGEAVFCLRAGTAYKLTCLDAQGATVWVRDNVRVTTADSGMANPMEAAGDLIVGGPDGQPDRLAAGTTGQVLKIGADGNPGWSTDEKGMSNPMTTAGDIIVGGASGAPARLGVGTSGKILTSNGTTATWEDPATQPGDHKVLTASGDSYPGYLKDKIFGDGDAIRVTTIDTPDGEGGYDKQIEIGVDATGRAAGKCIMADGAGNYGWETPTGDHKVSADGTDTAGYLEDKIGAGSGISLATSAGKVVVSADTQTGDHKTAVDAADASPDYLANKLAAGSGISLTNTGSAVEIAATAQTGDHQLLVSATDAAAGFLGAKLTAGANVTLTPQTDGDGVQTLEISATGGGGGGGVDEFVKWTQEFVGATGTTSMSTTQSIVLKCYADTDMIPEEVVLPCDHQYANTTYKAFIVVGTETFSSSTVSFSGSVSIITPATTPPRVAHIPLTGKNGFTKIEEGKTYFLVFGKSVGSTSEYFKQDYGVTLYHARTYAGAITETPNWVWNNASAQTGLPIVGLKFKRE